MNKDQFDASAAITVIPKSVTADFNITGSALNIELGNQPENGCKQS
jgi:hypothetical protein